MSPAWLDFYRGRRVLVTGHTGFKGSWLVHWLAHLGAEVHGLALAPVRRNDNFVITGLGELMQSQHIVDIRDARAVRAAFAEAAPDVAFHLAAQALVLPSHADPAYTFEVNVGGTVAFLEAARHAPTLRAAVVVTSDKCYQAPTSPRALREEDPLGGSDPYSASKAAAELVTASYRASFFGEAHGRARLATARAGNVIGAGDRAEYRIVPDCVAALERGEAVAVRNPDAVRPWQHVLEPLAGYLLLGQRLATERGFDEAWNFGPPLEAELGSQRVAELVQAAIEAWGHGEMLAAPRTELPRETQTLMLDPSKARTRLGWRARLSFREAVRMTIDGYRAERGDAAAVRRHRLGQIADYTARLGVP